VLANIDSFSALRFDPKGELFVGSPTRIDVYHLGDLTKPVRTVIADGSLKYAIDFNASNDFVTASDKGVSFYTLGATAPHANLSGFAASDAVYDINGYLAVSRMRVGGVIIFAPGHTSPGDTLSQGIYNPPRRRWRSTQRIISTWETRIQTPDPLASLTLPQRARRTRFVRERRIHAC
jgi:hypothetical protein